MNLSQALKFSSLSDYSGDGCTFAPNLGIVKYCDMHDRFLVHLVQRTVPLNVKQIEYLESINIYFADYHPTWLDSHRLLRDGITEKLNGKRGIKKGLYWVVKWLYYFVVYGWSLVRPQHENEK